MLLFLILMGLGHANPVISPSKLQSIAAGTTVQFKANAPVKWSLAPGSPGTIDEDGTYHAPKTVPVHNSIGGCQLLPNDHILNTRVDTLPVHAKSAEWLAMLPDTRFSYYPSWGTNIADGTTPRQNMRFLYSPENDGKYEFVPWPDLQRENGVFSSSQSEVDRHVLTVDKESCKVFEVYNNYSAGSNTQCATCTAQGGVSYSGMSYELPTASSDAAGLFIAPLTIRLSEIRSGSIRHAARFSLANGYISPSSAWPSRAHAGAWGKIPYGTRFRLRADFDISSFSPAAKVLLTELKEYGMMIADGGSNWEIQTSTDVTLDPTVEAALLEIRGRGPHAKDLQAVDESSLMISEKSGKIKPGNSFVKDDGAVTIVATDIKNPESTSELTIPLRGVVVGVPRPSVWIQSGVKAQFTAWVTGTDNKSVNWSMPPGLGLLTASGAYSAPTVDRPTATLVTVASAADPEAKATIVVTVMPPGDIRVKVGNATHMKGAPNKYGPDYGPDSEGHMWWRDQAGEVSWGVLLDDWNEPWPKQKDISLYYTSRYSFGDMVYRYLVPNGDYKISIYFAQTGCKDHFSKDIRAPIHIEAQGQIILRDFDIGSAVGYTCLTPTVQSIPATVKDNSLYFAMRRVTTPHTTPSPLFNAYSISLDNSPPHLAIDPAVPQDVVAGDQRHLYSVGWYMSNDVTWSVDGPGSITADGLYAAPLVPPKSDKRVRVAAHSKTDSTKIATAQFMLRTGDMVIAPASLTTVRSLSKQFKVTFGHTNYTNVEWSVTPNVGTISGDGVYVAPDSLAQDTQVKLTARSKDLPDHSVTAEVLVKAAPEPIRINCGDGPAFTDAQGHLWVQDYGYSKDTMQNHLEIPISGTTPDMQQLYQSSRYRYAGDPFNYTFDVPNGRYSVTLKFADYGHNEPGNYVFDVKLNGKKILAHFDPDKERGPHWANDKTFETTVTNKMIRLDFLAEQGSALINGIEINYLGP